MLSGLQGNLHLNFFVNGMKSLVEKLFTKLSISHGTYNDQFVKMFLNPSHLHNSDTTIHQPKSKNNDCNFVNVQFLWALPK